MRKLYTILILITLVAGHAVRAQTCNGEIVKFQETFGQGNGRAPLPVGRTNYDYNSSSSLADGDYTLSKSTHAKPEWHDARDHTGDRNGRMMVTNASFPPGEFYRDTVSGLSSVSTYTVYFYAMNVNTVGTCSPNPILPRLQLVVESYNPDGTFTQISSMVSDALPQTTNPTWVKIVGQIYLPIDVTAVRYRIINNSTGGCGNDLAIDDITFSQCEPVVLPLTGFTLKTSGSPTSVLLSWSTLTEINTDKFFVERSNDNRNWKNIATVKAAGQSTTRKEYTATDGQPFSPVCFYRIESVDLNGRSVFSNITVIQSGGAFSNQQLAVHPNPFTNLLTVEMLASQRQYVFLRLFDLNGKIVRSVPCTLKSGSNSISISGLAGLGAGMYFLDIADMSGTALYRTKVVKY